MTYEDFLQIPPSALKDLEIILTLKRKYCMDFTDEEIVIQKHFADWGLNSTKNQLERILKLD
jgi:hypothetical protein